MVQIDKSLDDSVDIVNRLMGDELDYLNKRNGKAIWIVGDCLVIAERFTELCTKLELVERPSSPSLNPDAHKSWQKLIDKLNRNYVPVRLGKDSDTEVEKTLANVPPYDSDELLKWENQKEHYSAFTLEEIGEELLGPIQPDANELQMEPIDMRKSPGRHHIEEDIWLWEQIHTHKRIKDEALYHEWLAKMKEINPNRAQDLRDSKRQFNDVIKPKWRGTF